MIELNNGQLEKMQMMLKRFPRAIPRAQLALSIVQLRLQELRQCAEQETNM